MMEAYIPKENMQTIDIGANDYRLLSNNCIFDSRPINNIWHYEGAGNPQLLLKLLKKYGAEPTKVGNCIYTKNRVTIPLRDETWSNVPEKVKQQLDDIIAQGETYDITSPYTYNSDYKALRLNQKANDILSQNGKKVIKYTNTNPFEVSGNDGISYIITDPSVFYNTGSTLQQRSNLINMTKYPLTYGLFKFNKQN